MLQRKPPQDHRYLPTPIRVVAIVHLCWIFTYLVWVTANPVLNEHIAFKTQMALYKTVMGHEDLAMGMEEEGEKAAALRKLRSHAERFALLGEQDQSRLREGYTQLLTRSRENAPSYFGSLLPILAFGIPPFVQAYILFSLIVSFFLLLRIEGAAPASWVLPLLLIVFIVHNHKYAPDRPPSAEAALFPEESQLVQEYLHGQLSEALADQMGQLTRGWEDYLISEYAKETPSSLPEKREKQVAAGEFWFNLARLDAWRRPTGPYYTSRREVKGSLPLQLLALSWTLFFTLFINRRGTPCASFP